MKQSTPGETGYIQSSPGVLSFCPDKIRAQHYIERRMAITKYQHSKRRRVLIPVAAVGMFLVVLPHLAAGESKVVAVLQAVLPLLALATLGVSILLMFRGKRIAALLLGVAVGAALLPGYVSQRESGVQRSTQSGSTPSTESCGPEAQLSVLTLNAGRGSASVAELADYIHRHDPHVLVLVETNETMIASLAEQVSGWNYKFRTSEVIHGGSVDSVILSRLPLRQEPDAVSRSRGALFDVPVAVAEDPELGSVRIAAIHPIPPTHEPEMWASTLEQLRLWHSIRGELPLVLAGDFNATHANPEFRAMSRGFSDVSPRIGPIDLATWPADLPIPAFAAIDHVLARGLLPVEAERLRVSGTDHHGILAHLGACG